MLYAYTDRGPRKRHAHIRPVTLRDLSQGKEQQFGRDEKTGLPAPLVHHSCARHPYLHRAVVHHLSFTHEAAPPIVIKLSAMCVMRRGVHSSAAEGILHLHSRWHSFPGHATTTLQCHRHSSPARSAGRGCLSRTGTLPPATAACGSRRALRWRAAGRSVTLPPAHARHAARSQV